jgi:hypothetical protein
MKRMRIGPSLGDGAGQARAAATIRLTADAAKPSQMGRSGNISDGAPRGSARRESDAPERRRARDRDTVPSGVLASRFRAPGCFLPRAAERAAEQIVSQMKRIGSHSLGEFPSMSFASDASACGRPGSYGKDRLAARIAA